MAPLWQLCSEGKLERVRLALRGGGDVNSKDGNNKTALMWAVKKNHNGVVRLLLEQPAIQVNSRHVDTLGRQHCFAFCCRDQQC